MTGDFIFSFPWRPYGGQEIDYVACQDERDDGKYKGQLLLGVIKVDKHPLRPLRISLLRTVHYNVRQEILPIQTAISSQPRYLCMNAWSHERYPL